MVPEGVVSTGWPAVEATCAQLGVRFDEWQAGAGKLILAKRKDGLYAADTVVLSIPRQVGKTFLIGWIIFALCLINPGITVIWTAHRFKTARDVFDSLRALALSDKLAPHIKNVYSGAGDEKILFNNGSRIMFGARERGFGRGIPNVSILVFDEAQILGARALDDMVPTTNRAKNPLIFMIGTPPKPEDDSAAFTQLRADALAGRSDDVLYLQFGADPETADASSKESWAQANPSFPHYTSWRALQRMVKLLTPDSVLREGLGVWDEEGVRGPFRAGAWGAGAVSSVPPPQAVGLALDIDRSWLSLAAANRGDDDSPPTVGAVVRTRLEADRAGMVARVKRITDTGIAVAVDSKGPAGTLVDDLLEAGIPGHLILEASLTDYIQACADFFDAVEDGRLRHGNDAELNAAVAAAGWRQIGDRRAWSRKRGDVSMLEAATLALWGAQQSVTYDVLNSFG